MNRLVSSPCLQLPLRGDDVGSMGLEAMLVHSTATLVTAGAVFCDVINENVGDGCKQLQRKVIDTVNAVD